MKKLFFAASASLILLGCTKEKEAAVSDCIQDRLKTFDKSEACANAVVTRYEFQGQTVYTFDRGDCVAMDSVEVRSEDCALLGYLGGYLENDSINKAPFYAQATYVAVIWAAH